MAMKGKGTGKRENQFGIFSDGHSHRNAKKRSVWLYTMLGVMVAGTALPGLTSTVVATDIKAATGFNATTVTTTGNVTTVETTKVINNTTAVNVFDTYKLSQGGVANMYFGSKVNNSNQNLVNFVRDKIDINGVVNAVQNNKIGGNLYFLSSDGIAISKTGVINAGAVTLMTPTNKYMDNLVGVRGSSVPAAMLNTINDANISNIVDPGTVVNIPLNPTGTISVDGWINAVDGITLRAGHEIDIGTGAGAQASLRTGITDFSSFVNTDSTSAGLESPLKATPTGSGDIVLVATASEKNINDDTFHKSFTQAIGLTDNNTIEAKVVQKSGVIETAGKVLVTAEATNTQERVAQTVATVDITGGTIQGNHVIINADANNSFADGGTLADAATGVPLKILGAVTANIDADYALLGSKAAVNIGSDAVLTATGINTINEAGTIEKALDIQANSVLGAEMGAATTPFRVANIKASNIAPAAAVTYLEGANSAKVQIDGTLKTTKTTGDANVSATATTEIAADASTTTITVKGNPSLANAALLVLNASNTAAVNLGSTAQLQGDNLQGKLDISSTANNSLAATVSTSAPDKSAVASAVNITTYDSSSTVDIAAGAVAADVTIHADNNVLQNTVTTTNAIGATALMKTVTNKLTNSQTFNSLLDTSDSSNNSVANLIIGKLPAKLQDIIYSPADPNSLGEQAAKLGKMISVGVGVQYTDESNASKVTVHTVPITARTGNVSIGAKTDVQDTHMVVAGAANNQQDDSQVQSTADGAILIARMDNTSQTVINGGTSADHTAVSGKNVTITANTTMPYNRVNKLIEGVTDAVKAVEDAYAGSNFSSQADYNDALNKIETAGKALSEIKDGDSFSDKLSNAGTALSNYASAIGSLIAIIGDDTSAAGTAAAAPIGVLKNAVQFVATDQYANFYVRTAALEGQGAQNSKLALAGSVNVTDVTNNSRVLIGKNAVLTATEALKTTAGTKAENVSFTGNVSALLLPDTANAAGVGASVAIQRFSSDSLVLAAEGDKLTGAAIDVEANTTLTPTGVVLSAGTAGTNGLSGMLNIMSGSGSAIASVDDEAVLTANKAGSGTIAEKQNDGSITIGAANDTILTNVSGGFMKASGTSVGVGVAVNNYGVNTIAGVFDNDADADVTKDTAATTVAEKGANEKKAASKQTLAMSGLEGIAKADLLGSSSMTSTGLLKGQSVTTDSTTSGVINSVGVAGAVATSDDSGEEGVVDKIGNFISGIGDKITTPLNNGFSKIDGYMSGKLNDLTGYNPAQLANSGSSDQKEAGAKANSLDNSSSPKVTIAGSVAINMLDGQSSAILDKANVTLLADPVDHTSGSLTSNATDTLFSGAWGGAAAINWATTTKQSSSGTTVGVSGAAAANVIDRNVDSIISNSTVKNAGSIINRASKDGAEVAAALGLTLSESSGSQSGTNVAVAAAVSYNSIDSDVHALMINDRVGTDNGAVTALQNDAYNGDIQVTGGVNAALSFGGQSGAGVGGSIVIGTITDDVQSVISGGTYTQMGNVDVTSVLATKQIGIGVGVAASSSANSGTFEGVATYNAVSNTANAAIDSAAVTTAGNQTVAVKAYDTNSSGNSHAEYITNRGLDADGASYVKALDNGHTYTADEADQNYNKAVTDSAAKTDENGGNIIVTGALSVSGSGGKGAVGAGVAIDQITNDFTSHITDSTITAGAVEGKADTDTILVGFSVGAAGGQKFGGAGSVSWQDLNSSAVTTVSDSTIKANRADFNATNDTIGVNVAGQVSVGKVATGLAMAYHGLDNTTGAYVYGSDLQALDAAKGITVGLDAESSAKIFSVGAGVGVSTKMGAINGVITMNRGSNTTEAVIDSDSHGKRTSIMDANDIKTVAKDNTVTVAIAGGVTAGGGIAVGGAVAINDIGGFSSDGAKSSQQIKAQINHTDITSFTPATGAMDQTNHISTDASDDAHMITVAAGIGASSQTAVQGAAATSLINKNVVSGLNMTNIDANTADSSMAKINTTAANDALIVADAVVLAGSVDTAIGAGVGVNRIVQNTEASITGGTQHVANTSLKSTSNPDIIAVGVGGAGSDRIAIAGSFGINMIQNDTKAVIDGATMVSQENIGIVAQSDEYIENVVGTVSGSGVASVGLSASVNTISGHTEAVAENSNLTAKGSDTDAISTSSDMKDGAVLTSFVDKGAFVPDTLRKGRQTTVKTGLVVDSSSTHSILSTVFSAGANGLAAALGTANVNDIGGATTAKILDSNVNRDLVATDKADVAVKASDYTNEAGFTGTAAGSGNVAAGAASDTNIVGRTVQASVENDKKNAAIPRNTIHAADFTVDAVAQQGLSSFDVGVGVAGQGAAVVGTVTVSKLQGTTAALVDSSDITSGLTQVAADHQANVFVGGLNVSGAAMGAAIGAAIDIADLSGTTSAEIKDSSDVSSGDVTVKADDATMLNTIITSGAISGLGVSALGNTSVNNIRNTVTARTTDSKLTGRNVTIQADNNVQTQNIGGLLSAGGFGGAGVSVSVNTFDSTVGAVVSGGNLTAADGNVTVKAADTRDVEQIVVNTAGGIVGAGANIMVTVAGKKVDNEQAQDNDAASKIDAANTQANSESSNQTGTLGLTDTEKQRMQQNRSVAATHGGDVLNAGISAKVTGAALTAAKGTVSVTTEEKNDIIMHGGNAVVGGASLNGSVGILKLKHNAQTSLEDAAIIAKDINLTSSLADKKSGSTLNLYQGTAGAFVLGAAYGKVSVDGASGVSVKNSNLTASTGDIAMNASDTASAAVNAYGLSGGLIAAGAIVVDSDNTSTVSIDVDSTDAAAAKTIVADSGAISMTAHKDNAVKATAYGGAVGLSDIVGLKADATDTGTAAVHLTGSQYTLSGKTVEALAKNTSRADVQALNAAVGIFSAQLTKAKATVNAKAALTVDDNNTFKADTVNLTSQVGSKDNMTANAKVISIGTSALLAASANSAQADTNTETTVMVGSENYVGSDGTAKKTNLTISGKSEVGQQADAMGLTVSGMVASGSNLAETNSANIMTVQANGGVVNNLILNAVGSISGNAHANGDGGSKFDISPEAAVATNTFNNTTTTNLSGNWSVNGDILAAAVQRDTADVQAEATHVGVAAVTGSKAVNTISGETSVNISDGADITAETMTAYAQNNVRTGDAYEYAVNGRLYGGIAANGVSTEADVVKTAAINIGNAQILTSSTQVYDAETIGTLKNNLRAEAAGAVTGAIAKTNNVTHITDEINVAEGARLFNKGNFEDGDVTLSAHDGLNLTATADAVIPAGVGGWASAKSVSAVTRNNKINVQGYIVSAKDLNLYAGAAPKDSNVYLDMYGAATKGGSAYMNLYGAAAAYNHTAIPVATKPSIDLQVHENNQVVISTSGIGEAVQHINVTADSGKDAVKKETNTYSWVKGGSSTDIAYVGNANGEASYGQVQDNYAQVDGSLTAGIKNKVTVDISGVLVPDDSYIAGENTQGKLTVESSDADLKNGVITGTADYGQALYDRWQTLNTLLSAYAGKIVDSKGQDTSDDLAAYTGYLQEMQRLEKEMDAKGLREAEPYTNPDGSTGIAYVPVSGYQVNYIALPDIAASGGDINVHAGSLKGSGKLTANGSPSVNITNTSTVYLRIGNITIGDPGGEILLNGTTIGNDGNAKINELNSNKTYVAAFDPLHTDDPSGNAAQVNIRNEYSGGDITVIANDVKLRAPIQSSKEAEFRQNKENELAVAERNALVTAERDTLTEAKWNELVAAERNQLRYNKMVELKNAMTDLEKAVFSTEGALEEYLYGQVDTTYKTEIDNDVAVYVANKDTNLNPYKAAIEQSVQNQMTTIEQQVLDYMATDSIKTQINDYMIAAQSDISAAVTKEYNDLYYGNSTTPLTKQYKPVSTVEINGMIDNQAGSVTVDNRSGDIIITPLKTDGNAGINAKNIILNATGTISQGYVNGIVNIGNTPEYDYSSYAQSEKEKSPAYQKPTVASHYVSTSDPALASSSGSRIAGDNIYINASDINVNGLIQSGYSKYYADIASDALSSANLEAYANDASKQLKVGGNTWYKVNNGGRAVLQSDGTYAYEVQVYYNPSTSQLIVEDINAQGGKVYLTGRISSTGNGKVIAVDGGADISINNHTEADLNVGKVLNNDREGVITITDTNLDTQTLYRQSSTTTITNYSKSLNPATASQSVQTESGPSSSYTPQTGLRYNWTEGTVNETKRTYQRDVRKGLWGAVETRDSTALKNYESTTVPTNIVNIGGEDKPTGAFVSTLDGASGEYTFIADNTITDNSRTFEKPWVTKSGFLGWFRTTHYRWTVDTGSSQSYVNSLAADKAIDIGFIGQKDGTINLAGMGNVNLTGAITNNNTVATLKVTSQNGAIGQTAGTTIKDNFVTMQAATGITGLDITSLGQDTVNLTANTNSGNITANVSGGVLDNHLLKGNVILNSLKTGSDTGKVSLTATGDITQAGTDLSVKGSRVDLISTNGAIGTATQALIVQGGQNAVGSDSLSASVNASAKGNIFLTQQSGNMRVGLVQSQNGDVALAAADGDLIDALPVGEQVNNVDPSVLIKRWQDAGLIAGEGAYTTKLTKAVKDYEANAARDYSEYTSLKQYYDSIPAAYARYRELQDQYAADPQKTKTDEYQSLSNRFSGYNSADDYIKANKAAAYDALADKFSGYNKVEDYLTAEATDSGSDYAKLIDQRDHPTYEWTKDQLLYAIRDAVINKQTGSTDTELKQANVSGKNVTLLAKNVGIDSGKSTVISLVDLTDTSNEATLNNLKLLANAEAADVTWDTENKIATIHGKVPFGVNATNILNVQSTGNAYLAGRSDSKDIQSALNVGTIQSNNGDVRLLGKAGVYNALATADPNFVGNNLIVEGGIADIGAADKYITIDLKGSLEARTEGSIYITDAGTDKDLKLNALYAGKAINLKSNNSIIMDPAADPQAYVNAKQSLTLEADADNNGTGDVGMAGTAVRVNANGAVVNAFGNNVYLSGKNNGDLVLGMVQAKDGTVQVESEGTIDVGKETVTDETGTVTEAAVAGSIRAKTNSALSAAQDIRLTGPITIGSTGDGQSLSLTAKAGAVIQTNPQDTTQGIKTDVLHVTTYGNQSLANEGNAFSTFYMNGIGNFTIHGNVDVKTNAPSGLTANLNNSAVMGQVSISNLAQGSNAGLTLEGGVTTIDNSADPGTVAGDVTFIAAGTVVNNGLITSIGNGLFKSLIGAVDNEKAVTAKENVILQANTAVNNMGDVTATAGQIGMTARMGDIANMGNVQAGTAVTMKDTDGSITNEGQVIAGTDANLQTTTGDIINKGVLSAGSNVKGTTENGKIQALKDVTATTGDVLLKAVTGRVEVGSASGDAAIMAGNTVSLATDSTTKSDIEIYGNIVGTKGIGLTTNVGDIIWRGKGTAVLGPVQTISNVGNIEHTGNIEAGTEVLQQTQSGSITNNGGISAGHDVIQQTQNGSIRDDGNINAGNDALLQTGIGDVGMQGNIKANRNITIHADNGSITAADGTIISAGTGNANVSSGNGDITLHELQALKDAGVDAVNGNVKIFRIVGENILIAVRNPEKAATAADVEAGTKLAVIGDNIDLGRLAQQDGFSNMLELALTGTDPAQPMNRLSINDVITKNGLYMEQLWAKNADIHVSAPEFNIDKLGIIDVAHLSNSDTTTTVWGSSPQRDGANTSYWYNPQNNSPWMFLYFTGRGHGQYSNGVLLRNDNYYYPIYNRFSGVDISLRRTDRSEHAYQQLADYYVQEVPGAYYGMYDRFDILETEPLESAPKADIVIEKEQ